jgi:uncharacterized protein
VSFAATRVRQQLREVAALGPEQPVPSPCNSVCRISESTGLCEGCLRTIDEVAAWSRLDDEGKRQVWQRLATRAGVRTPQEPR